MGCGILDMGNGIWDIICGVWDMGYGMWDMGYGPLKQKNKYSKGIHDKTDIHACNF